MKMSLNNLASILEWNESHHLCELIIESPVFLRDVIKNLTAEVEQPILHLTDNGEPLDFTNDVDIIFNPLRLDFNNRRAMTALLKTILKTSLSEDFYLSTNHLKTSIIKHLAEIVDTENFAFEVETGNFSIDAIAKATNIHIVDDEDNFIELLIDYVSMMTELLHTRLFIFVNLRSLISDDELAQFIQDIQNHQIDILLLENMDHGRFNDSSRIIVDADLCEI